MLVGGETSEPTCSKAISPKQPPCKLVMARLPQMQELHQFCVAEKTEKDHVRLSLWNEACLRTMHIYTILTLLRCSLRLMPYIYISCLINCEWRTRCLFAPRTPHAHLLMGP